MTANTPSVLYLRDFTSSARCQFAPTVFRSDDFDRCLSRVAFAKSVLLPERFRGGCSFGVITRRCRACTLPILRTPVWRSSASVAAQPPKNTPYQPLTPQLSAFNEALQQLVPYTSRSILDIDSRAMGNTKLRMRPPCTLLLGCPGLRHRPAVKLTLSSTQFTHAGMAAIQAAHALQALAPTLQLAP